ncbi:MAG: tetratricopeptide repeat protein [Lachnospiraceae bacterium]
MDSYNKIVRLSNTCYNVALEKAKVRDLSGAVESLRKSLRFYKENTQARNLLGLVYFEMGEVVDALNEWVISRSLKPEENMAEQYLESIQSNRGQLNSVNQTIKKYNQALLYCQQGNKDLAVIQLKKVLSLNPKLVKGHQLLALLYLEEKQYEQAKKELRAAGRIDANSTTTLRYLKEANQQMHGEQPSKKNSRKEKEELLSYQSGNETIIQPARFKDNSGILTIINILIGIAIGVAITFFLILPSIKQNATSDAKKAEIDANNSIITKDQEIKKLESTIEELQKNMDDKENDTKSQQEVKVSYQQLLTAFDAHVKGEVEAAGAALGKVQQDLLEEDAKAIYNTVNTQVNAQYITTVYQEAKKAYDKQNYEEAVPKLQSVVDLEEDHDGGNAIYYLAQSYRKLADKENAIKYYQKMTELHPNTERARTSQNYLEELQNE